MKIYSTRKRSGPIYRKTGSGVVSYVVEHANMSVSLGGLSLRLPGSRRVYVIDGHGVYVRKEQGAKNLVIPFLALLLALLVFDRLVKRRTSHRTQKQT
jgi:hypothetical protein